MDDLTPKMPEFRYSRRKDGLIARSDGALVPVFDEGNVCTQLYRKWEKEGGKLSEHVMSKEEERFEREQLATAERNKALEEAIRKAAIEFPTVPIIGKK